VNTTWNDSRFGPGSYEHAAQEDRAAPRARVHLAASLRPAGGQGFATHVRDLSFAGFTATAPGPLDPQTLCWLTIEGFKAVKAEVIWWEAGLFGAAFAHLIDRELFDLMVAAHHKSNQ